jgi:GNAT superfamily N-acetyltransferase
MQLRRPGMQWNIEVTRTPRYCYINAISNNERIGKICVDLQSEDANRYKTVCKGNLAKIILIQTNVSVCGQGIATALLNKTIEELADYNLYLNVVPLVRTNKDKSKNELIKFYSKFGFKKYKEDICVTTMIR